MKEYDVVIVGGGPAGISTAISCVNNGIKPLLVEKDDIYKMNKKTLALPPHVVKEFGLEECVINNCKKYTIASSSGSFHTVAVDYIGGQVVSHPKLTNLLLSRAEFDILNKTAVNDLKREGGKVNLILSNSEEIQTKLVVDASGAQGSIIPKKLGKKKILPPVGYLIYGKILRMEKLPIDSDEIVMVSVTQKIALLEAKLGVSGFIHTTNTL